VVCVTVCGSVLQCVTACLSVLQHVELLVCCVLQCVVDDDGLKRSAGMLCVAVCCGVLQRVAACCIAGVVYVAVCCRRRWFNS